MSAPGPSGPPSPSGPAEPGSSAPRTPGAEAKGTSGSRPPGSRAGGSGAPALEPVFTDHAATRQWHRHLVASDIELRLGPTRSAEGGFVLEGSLCLRKAARPARLEEIMPHLDAIGQQAARGRLQSVLAAAARAVYELPVRAAVGEPEVRFLIGAADSPHPASDPQLRLRIERGVTTWLREHWIRRE